ncbi:hypothetical protein E4U92_26590 [Streptomyces galbus]|uniref:Uncharacterized protein n=1 Tax=Streptomyces galbus TaxID=33898 RepID=A0A4U5WW07_STRGB|nr:hypothetical protein E4U92_26590 [Streptomyces galbus]
MVDGGEPQSGHRRGSGAQRSAEVSTAARDRLAQLAAEHGTTFRSLVENLAQGTPTQAKYAERDQLACIELAAARRRAEPRGQGPGTLLECLGAAAVPRGRSVEVLQG